LIKELLMGVDGGATKCTVRLEDGDGVLLGLATSGPANIRISIEQAWQSIHHALDAALAQAGLKQESVALHAGMGLAGCEMDESKQAFINFPHKLHTLTVTSDAHTACLGAHNGSDGAIIIIGTGMVGLKCEKGVSTKVAGWGFPYDDAGSGAWLGLEAIKIAFQSLDGRLPESAFSSAIHGYFQHDTTRLITWANSANSTRFAELAPLIIAFGRQGDPQAMLLLQRAALEIERTAEALALANLPCALVGGIAPHLEPYLNEKLRRKLSPAFASPDVGAIRLVTSRLNKRKQDA